MGILIALFRGTSVAATIILAFALLKRLIIGFGFLLAIVKFVIVIAFVIVLVSIGVAMLRGWCRDKDVKES
jgi:hypothetical protein